MQVGIEAMQDKFWAWVTCQVNMVWAHTESEVCKPRMYMRDTWDAGKIQTERARSGAGSIEIS